MIARASRHNESFRAAAAAVLVGEHGRWQPEERPHHYADHADPDRRDDVDRGGGSDGSVGGE